MGTPSQDKRLAQVMADLRRDFAPEPGNRGGVEVFCRRCGCTFWRWKRESRPYCPDCSAVRQLEAAESVRNHEGASYEKAVRGQLAHWHAEARRIGLE